MANKPTLDEMRLALSKRPKRMAEGGSDWKPHPENDLLQPIGSSKMVGEEKLIADDGAFKSGLSMFPSRNKSYRYVYHGEGDAPIGAMQIATQGPRSKKAVIQNLYVAEANRRQGIASKLLDRARKDFEVKHSNDLTTEGKAFAKNKKAKGGSVPSEPGSTPIKEGHVRLYHQTDGDNLREIEKHGLLLKHAKGIEGPRAIYAGETPFYGDATKKPTLEFQVPKEHWDAPFVLRDVHPQDFISAHYPWHRHARYLEDESGIKNVLSGKFDTLKGDEGKAVEYIKNKYSTNKAKGGSVEPKNTVKAYKLFRVHEKHPGKLFPLFVDANTPVEMHKWVDAKIGEQSGEKVKSKIGPLAMRPGWHAGDLPVATHIGEKSSSKLKKPDTRPHNHAWAEVEMPNDKDWQTEANKRGMNASGKIIHKHAHITDQLPKGGHYRYKTNPNMTGNWLIGGAMKVNRVLTDAEVKRINDKHGVADLPREEPFKKKTYGLARGGVVAPESWVAEEHVNHGIPKNIQPQFNALREEFAHKAMLDKSYQKHIAKMPFNDIPTMQEWIRQQKEKGGVTHAHHLKIEERPL